MTNPQALPDLDLLRMYLGERIPDGGSDTDTFFTDDELTGLLAASTSGVDGAALLGWSAKAAEYARLIDMNESGGIRTMSQRYRQAAGQVLYWQSAVAAKATTQAATVGRVGPKPISLRDGRRGQVVLYQRLMNRMPISTVTEVLNDVNSTVVITDELDTR